MSGDTPQLNLVVAVGAGGNIGPRDGLPLFKDEAAGREFRDWFLELSEGGVVIIGHRTMRMMLDTGWHPDNERTYVVWTRYNSIPTDQLVERLSHHGRPMFLIGGEKTYQAFMPYVTQFFTRRAELIGPVGCHLPPLFGTTNRSH